MERSEGSVEEARNVVATQVSFGGFGQQVTAAELSDFLEREIGQVWRCRLKTSSTPLESFPDFSHLDHSSVIPFHDAKRVVPHAFVHFAVPAAALHAFRRASRSDLFLEGDPLRANLATESSLRVSRRRATDPLSFADNVRVDVGTLAGRDRFLAAWRGPDSGVCFVVDPFDSTCKILFPKETAFALKSLNCHAVIRCDFKLEFLVRELRGFRFYTDRATMSQVLLLQLESSPCVYYRTADDNIHVSVPFNLLDDEDPWIRTTDFTPSGAIGRCNSYRISFSLRYRGKLNKVVSYFQQRRIFEYKSSNQVSFQNEPDFGSPMLDAFFCIQYHRGICFDLLYMVNALLHKGIFNQYELNDEFYQLLRDQSMLVNMTALRHIFAYKHPIFDAPKRLKLVQDWLLRNPRFLMRKRQSEDNVEVRRLVITPTKAYCLLPEVELSNRVIRKYQEFSDRFLRVTFMDEGMQQLNSCALTFYVAPIVKDITSNPCPQKTTIFKRVRSILKDGFYLCSRKYSFLAFSANQLRDRSAWFFADDKTSDINVMDIRSWMGNFLNRNVAKYAARMGLCFSSTYATIDVPKKQVDSRFPDVERNEYVFSDGIGKITPDLAAKVARKLQLASNPPSAYQIRYAGCKGVVACWPGKDDGIRLSLRRSMNKFISNHTTLEVVSWTRFQPGFLNRQIVTLLSALGVPDDTFSKMQDSMVNKLDRILHDTDVAFEVLITSCSEQGNSAALMLSVGFSPQTEPHLKGMLSCIRSAQLGDLLAKARIFVPSGRWLMGCFDELGLLEYGQCFIRASTPSLENCFVKHGSRFSSMKNEKVITGLVVVAKNPCLHPGDIRVLKAVDVPELHHLVDCLVFTQKGERPHPNEASGSDLDGDLYFVTWDENLVPPSKQSWAPMDYKAAEVKELNRSVNNQDVIEFFARNMISENLGVICNAHVVHADQSELGALDEKCLHLAELAAIAVDFPKTGKSVSMPPDLRPKLYPDFMGKDDFQSYPSKKVLGNLFRKVRDGCAQEMLQEEPTCASNDLPYDLDLEIPGFENFVVDAWSSKCLYDGQLNALLGQYKVRTEEEAVTGHVWSMPKYSSRKQGELKEKLKHAYTALHKEFRHSFEALGNDIGLLTDDERNHLYEQKASAWYHVTYHPRWVKKFEELREPDGDEVPLKLSFAWIPVDYLVCIKVRCCGVGKLDTSKPINALAKYLVDKI